MASRRAFTGFVLAVTIVGAGIVVVGGTKLMPSGSASAPASAVAQAYVPALPIALANTAPQTTNSLSPSSSETSSATVAVTLPVPSPSPTPSPSSIPAPSPPTSDLRSRVVAEGDAVTATGWVQDINGGTSICEFRNPSWEADCFGVPITGIDVSALSGWSNGSGRSDWLTVRGAWTGGRITVTSIGTRVPGPSGRGSLTDIPCTPPPNGWRAGEWKTGDGERLDHAVPADSTLYYGPEAFSVTLEDGRTAIVAVIGTVGDVETLNDKLATIVPDNLCVTKVDYANSTIATLEQRLDKLAPQEDWSPLRLFIWDRVWLQLRVLDEHAFQLLEPDANKLVVNPLVQRASP